MNRRGFLGRVMRTAAGAAGATLLARAPQTLQLIEGETIELQPIVESAPKFIVDPANLSLWQRGIDGAYSAVTK